MAVHHDTEAIRYREGTTERQQVLGDLKVHTFKQTLGAELIHVPEHSIFLLESAVVTNDVWEGQREPQREWLQGDVIFLPADTEVCAAYVSQPYSETMIRMPDDTLRAVAKGDIDPALIDIRFMGLPRPFTFGVTQAVKNMAAAEVRHAGFAMVIEAATQSLAVGVLYALAAEAGRKQLAAAQHGLSQARRRRVLEFIEANLSKPITLTELAQVAALSPYHFTRAFRREMGATPMRYVWHRRARLAKRMLLDPGMPLVAIAHACGFASQSHFTTAFKADTGATPAAWRRAHI